MKYSLSFHIYISLFLRIWWQDIHRRSGPFYIKFLTSGFLDHRDNANFSFKLNCKFIVRNNFRDSFFLMALYLQIRPREACTPTVFLCRVSYFLVGQLNMLYLEYPNSISRDVFPLYSLTHIPRVGLLSLEFRWSF